MVLTIDPMAGRRCTPLIRILLIVGGSRRADISNVPGRESRRREAAVTAATAAGEVFSWNSFFHGTTFSVSWRCRKLLIGSWDALAFLNWPGVASRLDIVRPTGASIARVCPARS